MEEYEMVSCICGYRIYHSIWNSCVEEKFNRFINLYMVDLEIYTSATCLNIWELYNKGLSRSLLRYHM